MKLRRYKPNNFAGEKKKKKKKQKGQSPSSSSVTLSGAMLQVNYFVWTSVHKLKNGEINSEEHGENSCSKRNAIYYRRSLSLLAYSLPRSVHLVSRLGTLLGYELSVAGMAPAKTRGFTRRSLCASNETDFSNNISKAGESEAAMQTLRNYCCGPVIALPKSRFNNMKC